MSIKSEDLSSNISDLENELNFVIYKLYNLSYDEVLIIYPQTPITRKEYEKGGIL